MAVTTNIPAVLLFQSLTGWPGEIGAFAYTILANRSWASSSSFRSLSDPFVRYFLKINSPVASVSTQTTGRTP